MHFAERGCMNKHEHGEGDEMQGSQGFWQTIRNALISKVF